MPQINFMNEIGIAMVVSRYSDDDFCTHPQRI